MQFGVLNVAVILVYLAGMLGIGLYFARRQRTAEEYFLAGRSMPWLPVAMSMYASLTSATTYLALPGKAYSENISLVVVCLVSPALAPVLIFVFYPFYRRFRVTTSYEYIEMRFGRAARVTIAGLFLLARLGWLGLVIYAPALALSVVTGIPLAASILVMGALATAYTALGGLAAVLWTDVVQFVVLVGGAVWLAVSLLQNVDGGAAAIFAAAGEAGRLQVLSWRPRLTEMTGLVVFFSFFCQMMNDYGTDQVTVQRLLAVKEDRGVWKAILFNAGSDFVIIALLLFLGLGIFAFDHQGSFAYPDTFAPDQVIPYYIIHALPDGVAGLVIAAIFAAAMSSMDSGIHSMSTVIENDLLLAFRRDGPMPEARKVLIARAATVLLGALSTAMAFFVARIGGIIESFATFMSLFSAPILALFLLGILTRRGNFPGWLGGAAVAIAITAFLQRSTPLNWTYYFPVSFLLAFGIGYLLSRLWPAAPAPAHLTLAFSRNPGAGAPG